MECAEKWQMEPVLWMFDGSHADVDSDCKLIVELRATLHEKTKLMAKVIAHCDGGDDNAVLRGLAGTMNQQLEQIQAGFASTPHSTMEKPC